MKNKKKIKKKLIVMLILFLFLATTTATSTINKKEIDNKTNEVKNLTTADIPFTALTLICTLTMDGEGFARHYWIGDFCRFVLSSSDKNFETSVYVAYLEQNETGNWEVFEKNFVINGPIHIKFTSYKWDVYMPGFLDDGILKGWHGSDTQGWGLGRMSGLFYGCLYIPELPLYVAKDALESLKSINFFGNILKLFGIDWPGIGPWLYYKIYEWFPDLVVEETFIPWPGYLRIY